MSTARADLPTLTEVVDLGKRADDPPAALPPQTESIALERAGAMPSDFEPTRIEPHEVAGVAAEPPLAYDEELVAQVMVRLQPRLEAWVEAQVRQALMEMLPVWTESAALSIVRDLRTQMPELLSLALDEVHRQRRGS